MGSPLVSVLIPTRNRAHLLGHAINAVQQQYYDHIQCIVVDCNSNDNTESVVSTFSNIEYLALPYTHLNQALNAALKKVSGKYTAILDSNCLWHPDILKNLVVLMETAELHFSISNYQVESIRSEPFDYLDTIKCIDKNKDQSRNEDWQCLTMNESISLFCGSHVPDYSAMLFRTDLLRNNYNEQYQQRFHQHFMLNHLSLGNCNGALYFHRKAIVRVEPEYFSRSLEESLLVLRRSRTELEGIIQWANRKLPNWGIKSLRRSKAQLYFQIAIMIRRHKGKGIILGPIMYILLYDPVLMFKELGRQLLILYSQKKSNLFLFFRAIYQIYIFIDFWNICHMKSFVLATRFHLTELNLLLSPILVTLHS